MMNFCTLFDSNYLDKLIVLYESLEVHTSDFTLYMFCFDDRAFNVLSAMSLSHAEILLWREIEPECLIEKRNERTKAEYCWTCTPFIIKYVLEHFPVNSCTYIDADLYFFENPQVLFDEIRDANANVVITEHRFSSDIWGQRLLRRSGKYCVEFNYFDQSQNAREALEWWKNKCYEWCYHKYEKDRMGDQKYLEQFPRLFCGVHELQNLGGGVAPWNFKQYQFKEKNNGKIVFQDKNQNAFELIFYHFQSMRYLSNTKVNCCSGTHSKKAKDAVYIPYLIKVEEVRKRLMAHDVTFSINKVYSSSALIAFWQRYLIRFRVKSLSDIYDLERINEQE